MILMNIGDSVSMTAVEFDMVAAIIAREGRVERNRRGVASILTDQESDFLDRVSERDGAVRKIAEEIKAGHRPFNPYGLYFLSNRHP